MLSVRLFEMIIYSSVLKQLGLSFSSLKFLSGNDRQHSTPS